MRDNLALAYVFGLGMVAVFNPCGFAMLPAWIAYFLASDEADRPSVARAVSIGATLTAGFVAVFLAIGLVIQLAASTFVERLPWLSVALGLAMIVVAVSLLLGRDFKVSLRWAPRAPRTRTFRAVFIFGVSYAFVSLACTIPLFLATVTTSMTSGNVGVGILHFVSYALGMGVILTALTVGLSFARASFVPRLRRVVPHVRRIAAVLLGLAGAYVAYYGWYTLQIYQGNLEAGGPAKIAYDLSASMTNLVIATGPIRIGVVAVAAVASASLIRSLRDNSRVSNSRLETLRPAHREGAARTSSRPTKTAPEQAVPAESVARDRQHRQPENATDQGGRQRCKDVTELPNSDPTGPHVGRAGNASARWFDLRRR